ncbi:MAG: PfkB family carbohydrate kinase, partial [Yoonia sp.]
KGSEGVTVLTRNGSADVAAVKAEVVDTVGAGDTFSAGFMADLDKAGLLTKATLGNASMDDLTQAAAFGAKVASITVSRAGANPPWASEL